MKSTSRVFGTLIAISAIAATITHAQFIKETHPEAVFAGKSGIRTMTLPNRMLDLTDESGILTVWNDSGAGMSVDDLVYVSGTTTDTDGDLAPTIALADADLETTRAQFVLTAAIANGASGVAARLSMSAAGELNTAAAAVGDPVYLSTTAGATTLTAPTGTDIVQEIGTVAVVNASGRVYFDLGSSEIEVHSHQDNARGGNLSLANAITASTGTPAAISNALTSLAFPASATGRGYFAPGFFEEADLRQSYDEFESRPHFYDEDGSGAPTGTTGDENVMQTAEGIYEYHVLGAGQTILFPAWDVNGVDIAFDLADNEGVEIGQGITARSVSAFTAGTDAFYLDVVIEVTDISGTDDLAVGFRLAEAYQANVDGYNTWAALNVISGDITIETELNGGGTTSTDTTNDVTDTQSVRLRVIVSSGGVVTYQVGTGAGGATPTLAAPTVTAAFTFSDADVLVPFIYLLHTADFAETTYLQRYAAGLQ